MDDNHDNHDNQNGGDDANPPQPVKAETAGGAQQPPVAQQQVSLKVVNADGAEMFFKIKKGTLLKKLIDAYCKKQGITRASVRFLFDGSPIDEGKTPEDLGMEDDDVIDAMVEQTGGFFLSA